MRDSLVLPVAGLGLLAALPARAAAQAPLASMADTTPGVAWRTRVPPRPRDGVLS